ncbi:MAG: isoprenyl transferase [Cryomorphaceae bacterium]|nr:isoprenyl transferase [Cryomorphaceae bacterium]|tara:strand:- start:291 stop:1040 length:750 start_codon:yes stop_codon:yes gene_type:complete
MFKLSTPMSLPTHIAIIMDGNGRWAKRQGFRTRVRGHEVGVEALRRTAQSCAELGISYLTVYAFSEENWARPKAEVDALMKILVSSLKKEMPTLMEHGIQLQAIGKLHLLPKSAQRELNEVKEATSGNSNLILTLALSYGSRQEILHAAKALAQEVADGKRTVDSIDEAAFSDALYTADMPDPDLVIRTSGEHRISNYLLWQISYAELLFMPVLWPDFSREHLEEALAYYASRERRMGKTSEQLNEKSA